MNYYALPLKAGLLMQGKRAEQVDIRVSVRQNIRLILKTMPLEYGFDLVFGSVLNKFQYATPPQKNGEKKWRVELREAVRKNLKYLLMEYEPRLKIDDVIIDLREPISTENTAIVLVKVEIKGYVILGRKEAFHFPDSELDSETQNIFPLAIPVGNR
jgi:predicted component of type VI protein secretion system